MYCTLLAISKTLLARLELTVMYTNACDKWAERLRCSFSSKYGTLYNFQKLYLVIPAWWTFICQNISPLSWTCMQVLNHISDCSSIITASYKKVLQLLHHKVTFHGISCHYNGGLHKPCIKNLISTWVTLCYKPFQRNKFTANSLSTYYWRKPIAYVEKRIPVGQHPILE